MSLRGLGIAFNPANTAPPPPPFSPDTIASCELWYDWRSSDLMSLSGSSINQADSVVGVWPATNSGTNRPTYVPAVKNGHGSVKFDVVQSQSFNVGTTALLLANATPWTWWIVFHPNSAPSGTLNGLFTSSNQYIAGLSDVGGYSDMYIGNYLTGPSPNLVITPFVQWKGLIVTNDGAGTQRYYLNDVEVFPSAGSPRAGGLSFKLGYDLNGFFDGYIMQFGKFNAELSGPDLANMRQWVVDCVGGLFTAVRPEVHRQVIRKGFIMPSVRPILRQRLMERMAPWAIAAVGAATLTALYFIQ